VIIEVVVTLPDGHIWQGELDIDDADLEIGEPGEEEIDLSDDEVRAFIHEEISNWLLQEKIGWVWAKKPE